MGLAAGPHLSTLSARLGAAASEIKETRVAITVRQMRAAVVAVQALLAQTERQTLAGMVEMALPTQSRDQVSLGAAAVVAESIVARQGLAGLAAAGTAVRLALTQQ